MWTDTFRIFDIVYTYAAMNISIRVQLFDVVERDLTPFSQNAGSAVLMTQNMPKDSRGK